MTWGVCGFLCFFQTGREYHKYQGLFTKFKLNSFEIIGDVYTDLKRAVKLYQWLLDPLYPSPQIRSIIQRQTFTGTTTVTSPVNWCLPGRWTRGWRGRDAPASSVSLSPWRRYARRPSWWSGSCSCTSSRTSSSCPSSVQYTPVKHTRQYHVKNCKLYLLYNLFI